MPGSLWSANIASRNAVQQFHILGLLHIGPTGLPLPATQGAEPVAATGELRILRLVGLAIPLVDLDFHHRRLRRRPAN